VRICLVHSGVWVSFFGDVLTIACRIDVWFFSPEWYICNAFGFRVEQYAVSKVQPTPCHR
jgi:hypothetical protein